MQKLLRVLIAVVLSFSLLTGVAIAGKDGGGGYSGNKYACCGNGGNPPPKSGE